MVYKKNKAILRNQNFEILDKNRWSGRRKLFSLAQRNLAGNVGLIIEGFCHDFTTVLFDFAPSAI